MIAETSRNPAAAVKGRPGMRFDHPNNGICGDWFDYETCVET
jgi:hypothetical protein